MNAQPRLGAIRLWRIARRRSARRFLAVAFVALGALTVAHHAMPEGDTMHGMHAMTAAAICMGLLVGGAVVARRRGIVRLARRLAVLRWTPRLHGPVLQVGLSAWPAPARDGPRRHLQLQVIRR